MKTAASIPCLLVLVLILPGCADAASRQLAGGDGRGLRFVDGVRHPYFSITPGELRVYEGVSDGVPRREEERGGRSSRVIDGVTCAALQHLVFDAGELVEVGTEWFAEDDSGRVWRFGEETYEAEGGELVLSPDSWLAGVDGSRPWVAFASEMRVGDPLAGRQPGSRERMLVTSTSETVTTAAGTFDGCLQIVDNPDDPDDQDIILYAPGVGRVAEHSPDHRDHLVLVRWLIERRESGSRLGFDVR